MSTPQQPPQQPVQPRMGALPPTITTSAAVIPDDNGQPLIALIIQYGTASMTIAVHEQMAADLCESVPQVLRTALDQLRRARTGLVLPPNGDIRGLILPPNGKPR